MVGLLPDIKSKIVGSESNFNQLPLKARFEEVKLRELGVIQSSSPPVSAAQNTPNILRVIFSSRQQRTSVLDLMWHRHVTIVDPPSI